MAIRDGKQKKSEVSLMLPLTPHPYDERAMIPIARGDVVSSHSIARRVAVAPFISSPIVRKQPVFRVVDLCCERQLACELAVKKVDDTAHSRQRHLFPL